MMRRAHPIGSDHGKKDFRDAPWSLRRATAGRWRTMSPSNLSAGKEPDDDFQNKRLEPLSTVQTE